METDYTVCPRCDYGGGYTPFHGPFQCRNKNCPLFSEEQLRIWEAEAKKHGANRPKPPDEEPTWPMFRPMVRVWLSPQVAGWRPTPDILAEVTDKACVLLAGVCWARRLGVDQALCDRLLSSPLERGYMAQLVEAVRDIYVSGGYFVVSGPDNVHVTLMSGPGEVEAIVTTDTFEYEFSLEVPGREG